MKSLGFFGLGVFCTASLVVGMGLGQPGAGSMNAGVDRTSYAIGHDLALSTLDRLQIDRVEFNRAALLQGFSDGVESNPIAYTEDELLASLMVLEREVNERHAQQRIENDPVFRAVAQENARKSGEFVERFAADEKTNRVNDGVFYRVKRSGDGESPTPGSLVRVKFEARLIDGTLIGDSADHSSRIDSMIDGAQAVMTRMRVGDVWVVMLSPEQAYGLGGRLPDVGPNEAVIAEVTLLGIE
ncbi:MAG: FKBP-type peptidyl-prolyl cis-trans isomerase N-terminal domain-containing protein [Phycisphaerales bacterium]